MNQFYKDPNGKLCTYTSMKKRAVYHQPFYTEEDRALIGDKARKFIMPSNKLWQKMSRILKNMGRTPVQV